MGCCASASQYPAEIPSGAALPPGIEVLDKNDSVAVQRAIDICARSFAGTATSEPPGEFHWILSDLPDLKDEAQLQERVHRLSAMMGFCVHFAFRLGACGLVLQAKPAGAWDESGPSGAGRAAATGVVVLYLYPRKWAQPGMMEQMNTANAAGASKWTKTQNGFMNGKKMDAVGNIILEMHKQHMAEAHIHVQVVGVDPEAQGAGVGSKMMTAMNAIADSLELPLYLECDADSRRETYYKKRGYQVVWKKDLAVKEKGTTDACPSGMVGMRRVPIST